MANNDTIEVIVVPEVPKVIPSQEIFVYVPIATTAEKGIASFNSDAFTVSDGVVYLKIVIFADLTQVDNPIENKYYKHVGTTTNAFIEGAIYFYHNGEYALCGDANKLDKNPAIIGATKTKITYDSKGLVIAGADAGIDDITGLRSALNNKVEKNANIPANTSGATKIKYDEKGLVTGSEQAQYTDIGGLVAQLGLKEDKANKVTSLSITSTDTQYPSAKCVYRELQRIQSQNGNSAYTLSYDDTAPKTDTETDIYIYVDNNLNVIDNPSQYVTEMGNNYNASFSGANSSFYLTYLEIDASISGYVILTLSTKIEVIDIFANTTKTTRHCQILSLAEFYNKINSGDDILVVENDVADRWAYKSTGKTGTGATYDEITFYAYEGRAENKTATVTVNTYDWELIGDTYEANFTQFPNLAANDAILFRPFSDADAEAISDNEVDVSTVGSTVTFTAATVPSGSIVFRFVIIKATAGTAVENDPPVEEESEQEEQGE